MARTEEISAEFKGKIIRAISREYGGTYDRITVEFEDNTMLVIELRADEDFAPINGSMEIHSIYA